jgi:hypothetical protein
LEIEDRVRWISLRKEGLLGRQLHDSSSQAGIRQKGGCIERGLFKRDQGSILLPNAKLARESASETRPHPAKIRNPI